MVPMVEGENPWNRVNSISVQWSLWKVMVVLIRTWKEARSITQLMDCSAVFLSGVWRMVEVLPLRRPLVRRLSGGRQNIFTARFIPMAAMITQDMVMVMATATVTMLVNMEIMTTMMITTMVIMKLSQKRSVVSARCCGQPLRSETVKVVWQGWS